jgi:polyisoprenoid-binding protein YceI
VTVAPQERTGVIYGVRTLIAAVALACVACSAPPAPPSPTPTSAAATATSPAPATLPPGALAFTVGSGTKATIRVHEQVAGVALPGEAVVTTTAVDGRFVLLADGTFQEGSKLRADLDALKSDSDLRDEWIKVNTLQTRRYRYAEFTPVRISGVPLPLPASGSWQATVEGTMKIKATEKPVAWDLAVTRMGGDVSASGAIRFRFGDYGMDVPANRLILSVEDDIHLEIALAARGEER